MRFRDVVGVSTGQVEDPPDSGVFVDQISERTAVGLVSHKANSLANLDKVNFDSTMSTTVSVMADIFADVDLTAFRYCKVAGVLWAIVNVEPARPRYILTLGGVYDGPTPEPSDGP